MGCHRPRRGPYRADRWNNPHNQNGSSGWLLQLTPSPSHPVLPEIKEVMPMPDVIVRCDYCGYDMVIDRMIPLQMGRKVDDVYIVKPCSQCSH